MAIGPIAGQGRQFRFAVSAVQRQMAFRYHASVFYSWRYAGAVPERLLILNDCVTVTGVIMDATINQPLRRADGVRHEPDGDTHGWLRVDPQFANLLSAGNMSDQAGNLVWEMVCHFDVTQADSIAACSRYTDTQIIPPIGSHVAITGTFVQDVNHAAAWNEIHPVSRIAVLR